MKLNSKQISYIICATNDTMRLFTRNLITMMNKYVPFTPTLNLHYEHYSLSINKISLYRVTHEKWEESKRL